MDKVLEDLLARRDAAYKAYSDFATPLLAEDRELTEDEEAKRTELRSAFERFDARIDEVRKESARAAEIEEARKNITPATPTVEVRESRTYGPDSPNSFIADLVRAHSPAFKFHNDALRRLNQHQYEVSVEIARGTEEGKRAMRKIREENRESAPNAGDEAIREMRLRGQAGSERGAEVRSGMDTTAGSGGSFVTPVYLVQKYGAYNEPGRAFVEQCNHQPLPDYGMTVYLPHVTGPAGIAAQASQNTGIQETDPSAGYLSANLTIEAGEVTVSQALLDRAGPGFAFDELVFDQLQRDYDPKIDIFVLTQALAGAGAITYTDASGFTLTARTAPGAGGFYSKVSAAKAAVRTAAGVVMNPTHLFVQPTRWEYISAWADTQGRPVVVPDYAGAFNAVAGGNHDGDAGVEGNTGYRLNGLPVFQDLNIPTPGTGADQAVVGRLSEVYVFEGTPVMRTLPQTLGNQLSVLLQLYSYVACIPRYPTAVQAISGTGMSAITF